MEVCGHFILGERAPGTPWVGSWMGQDLFQMWWQREKSLVLLGMELESCSTGAVAYFSSYNFFFS